MPWEQIRTRGRVPYPGCWITHSRTMTQLAIGAEAAQAAGFGTSATVEVFIDREGKRLALKPCPDGRGPLKLAEYGYALGVGVRKAFSYLRLVPRSTFVPWSVEDGMLVIELSAFAEVPDVGVADPVPAE